MAYVIEITNNAKMDIQQAIDWENSRYPKLGGRFFTKLNQRFKDLTVVPKLGRVREKNIRSTFTKSFQYTIYYTVSDNKKMIYILRVLHERRQPIHF